MNGSGSGSGYGYGYGDGSGYGYGDGYGSGYGDGYGDGDGSGSGYGDGYGDGYGSGYGDGYGDGDGEQIARVASYAVNLITTPFGPLLKIGCEIGTLGWWRAKWPAIARLHNETINPESIAAIERAITETLVSLRQETKCT